MGFEDFLTSASGEVQANWVFAANECFQHKILLFVNKTEVLDNYTVKLRSNLSEEYHPIRIQNFGQKLPGGTPTRLGLESKLFRDEHNKLWIQNAAIKLEVVANPNALVKAEEDLDPNKHNDYLAWKNLCNSVEDIAVLELCAKRLETPGLSRTGTQVATIVLNNSIHLSYELQVYGNTRRKTKGFIKKELLAGPTGIHKRKLSHSPVPVPRIKPDPEEQERIAKRKYKQQLLAFIKSEPQPQSLSPSHSQPQPYFMEFRTSPNWYSPSPEPAVTLLPIKSEPTEEPQSLLMHNLFPSSEPEDIAFISSHLGESESSHTFIDDCTLNIDCIPCFVI